MSRTHFLLPAALCEPVHRRYKALKVEEFARLGADFHARHPGFVAPLEAVVSEQDFDPEGALRPTELRFARECTPPPGWEHTTHGTLRPTNSDAGHLARAWLRELRLTSFPELLEAVGVPRSDHAPGMLHWFGYSRLKDGRVILSTPSESAPTLPPGSERISPQRRAALRRAG